MLEFPEQPLNPPDYKEFTPRCWSCRAEIYSNDRVYNIDDHWYCEDCFTQFVDEEYTTYELAEALEIDYRNIGDVPREQLEEEE